MAKRLTPPQLVLVLLVGLGVLAWMWWNWSQRQAARGRFEQLSRRSEFTLPQGLPRPADAGPRTGGTVRITIEALPRAGTSEDWYWLRVGDTAWDFACKREGLDVAGWAAWVRDREPAFQEIQAAMLATRLDTEHPDAVKAHLHRARLDGRAAPLALVARVRQLLFDAGFADVHVDGRPSPTAPLPPSGEVDER